MSSIVGVSQGSGYQSLYGKISSGKQLQSAADGAAELAISEKMNAQVGGLEQGSKNVSSGKDMDLSTMSFTSISDCPEPAAPSIILNICSLSCFYCPKKRTLF